MIPVYECDKCGACCRHPGVPVTAADMQRSPKVALSMTLCQTELGIGLLGHPKTGGCPLLVDNQCSIYEQRPDCCRRVEAGSPLCQWSRGKDNLPFLMPKT